MMTERIPHKLTSDSASPEPCFADTSHLLQVPGAPGHIPAAMRPWVMSQYSGQEEILEAIPTLGEGR